jgi:hypothetical protein
MIRARVITPWVGTGADSDPFRPKITNDISIVGSWSDVTGLPVTEIVPDPNMYVIELETDDATIDAIVAHKDYGVGVILWKETIVDEVIP